MRSALLSVKGVTRAQVKLEEYEAIVTYDPEQATIEAMIKAVSESRQGQIGHGIPKPTVKKGKAGVQLRMTRSCDAGTRRTGS